MYDWSGCGPTISGGEDINAAILQVVNGFVDLTTAQEGMLRNLGTSETVCSTGLCPTADFGYETTILAAMDSYEAKMEVRREERYIFCVATTASPDPFHLHLHFKRILGSRCRL